MIHAYLYDADGEDREVSLGHPAAAALGGARLLWVDVVSPDAGELATLEGRFRLQPGSLAALRERNRRPRLDNYGEYVQLAVETVVATNGGDARPPAPGDVEVRTERLHLICGPRFVVTVHDTRLPFLEVFRRQDKAETRIGAITGPALAVSLVDWNLGNYFLAVEGIEDELDELDHLLLAGPRDAGRGRAVLARLAALRARASTLRRSLSVQREVVYGLSRPDFLPVMGDGVAGHLHALSGRFDRAHDAVEAARDQLLASFELLETRTSQETNALVQTLTFVTVLIGALGVIAGVFGMNFPLRLFEAGPPGHAEIAFLVVLVAMGILSVTAMVVARRAGWLPARPARPAGTRASPPNR